MADAKSIASVSSQAKHADAAYLPPEAPFKPEVEVADLGHADVDTIARVLDTEPLGATPAECKRVLRKIDWYLLPMMCTCYCLTYLDKTCIQYSHLLGFANDLHFSSAEYSWLGSTFYFAYLGALPVHSYLFHKVQLGRYLAFCIFFWGVTLTLHAAAFNWAGLMVCRVFLGIFESAITPGFILITGRFWSTEQINSRTALWFSFVRRIPPPPFTSDSAFGVRVKSLCRGHTHRQPVCTDTASPLHQNGWAQILGGCISYGLLRQHDTAIPRWRELFIVLGLITTLFGVVTLLFMPSEPGKLMVLSEREKLIAVDMVAKNKTGIVSHKFEWYQVREAVIDPRVWTLFLCIICMDVANGALTNFGTTVITSLGFDDQKTSLLGLAQGGSEVIACALIVAGTFFTLDSVMGALSLLISIIGSGVLASHAGNVAKVSLYMFVPWFAPASMVLYGTLARSFSGETKRIVANAIFQVGYSAGNIIGAQIYRAKDAPEYVPAKVAMVALLAISWLMFVAFFLTHVYLNRQRDAEFGKNPEHHAVDDLSNQTDWEKRRFFRYPL